MSSKYYHTQRQSSSIKGLLTPLGSWDSHFSRHQPIIPSSEPSPFKGIFPKNRWSWKLFTLHSSLIPALEGRNLFLILQESQTPLFQHGRILSSLLDIPRPVPLYYISCLLSSVCGVDFLPGYLYFPSTYWWSLQGHGHYLGGREDSLKLFTNYTLLLSLTRTPHHHSTQKSA